MSDHHYSPLRYPGGKASLLDFLVRVLNHNHINYGTYVEGFAGGAGAALKLLMLEHVSDIYLNEKDPFIYFFWKSILDQPEELIKLIFDSKLNIKEWRKRKNILHDKDFLKKYSPLEIGYTGFYLNRCNRSGILDGGV